ncbi:PfkB family carbohydrate kinase [Actinobaculum sp. 313]|uniref:carbohydrate kinase family protein n=1 Tax=Actinobaculum sp. 313 TaxID=2495645 RepID=UPI000D528656|nr:PfkB family carbohydrate kinase [Actinobaculum sp. 313]AWE41855.1 hypothetical protein DDD63_02745 [Actinobaculum sp. 313]
MSVLTLGECFIQAVKRADGSWQRTPAGYMLNVSVALRRLGRTVRFVTDFGLDAGGTLLAEYFAAHSVELWLRADDQRNNPTSVLTTVTDSEEITAQRPSPAARLDFTWDIQDTPVSGACVLDLEMLAPRSVAFGGAACHTSPGAGKVRRWVEHLRSTTSVFYHLGLPPGFTAPMAQVREQAEAFIGLADVVCAPRRRVSQLYGATDVLTIARHWQELGAALVVVADDDGADFIPRVGEPLHVQAFARVVDTVGAEEAFFAALIDGISRSSLDGPHGKTTLHALTGDALDVLGSYATAAATVAASRAGVYPPSREEVISVSEARQVSDEPVATAV